MKRFKDNNDFDEWLWKNHEQFMRGKPKINNPICQSCFLQTQRSGLCGLGKTIWAYRFRCPRCYKEIELVRNGMPECSSPTIKIHEN